MNQKDYKEIVRILKKASNKGKVIRTIIIQTIVNDLADYFEREDKRCSRCNEPLVEWNIPPWDKNTLACKNKKFDAPMVSKRKFNKKQFLKDCGIK